MKNTVLFLAAALLLLPSFCAHADEGSDDIGPVAVERETTDYMNSIKFTFLSWFSGSTKVSYERALPELRQSAEICGSIISAGFDKYRNDPSGFTLRYGHKFFMPDKDELSLRGLYLRPEAVYSHYFYNLKESGERVLANMFALLATVGYQFVYNRFLADFWVGGGPAFGNPSETFYHHGFELWHWMNMVNTSLALSFSIRLGICF
ncbi:MAG: hypothetical protein IJ971_04905 [Bacteroidales bacterium]|nr:hypothetical protein [Bacteroidales bacterium]